MIKPKIKLETKEKGLEKIIATAKRLKHSHVKVGVLGDTSKGGAQREGGLTNAQIAAILEFGTQDGKIPPRPALRATFDAKQPELKKLSAELLGQVILDKMTVEQALSGLGAFLSTEVKKYITTTPLPGIGPPNAEGYAREKLMKQKGGKKKAKEGKSAASLVRTWVDTGKLVGAFTYKVELKDKK